jgi:hypothetical protein
MELWRQLGVCVSSGVDTARGIYEQTRFARYRWAYFVFKLVISQRACVNDVGGRVLCVGAAACLVLCSPIVRVLSPLDQSNSASSVPGEIPQGWQLVTGHGNGMIQIWGNVSGLLRPLVRIGERASPITSLVILEHLGALCLSHLGLSLH